MASPSAGGLRRDLTEVSAPPASPGAPVQGGRAACATMASADEPNRADRHPDAACSLRSEASHTLQPSEVDVVEAAMAEPAPQAVASEEPPSMGPPWGLHTWCHGVGAAGEALGEALGEGLEMVEALEMGDELEIQSGYASSSCEEDGGEEGEDEGEAAAVAAAADAADAADAAVAADAAATAAAASAAAASSSIERTINEGDDGAAEEEEVLVVEEEEEEEEEVEEEKEDEEEGG